MKKIAFIAAFIAIPLGFLAFGQTKHAKALSGAQTPVVLELFTSQSCSSCPPADKLLGQLAEENENIIALSCNVTYWNRLHWKDTLSKDFCTQRQRHYVQALRSRGPYTPQMVVNGRHEIVGSRGGAVRRAIATDLKKATVLPIGLNLNEESLQIDLPTLSSTGNYQLLLINHGSTHHQEISSGENRGRAVTYTNPVQDILNLGKWDGLKKTLNYDLSNTLKAKGYVVLVQKGSVTGEIVAAAQIKP